MNINEVSRRLADQAKTIARELLPNGKADGSEWKVGGTDGGKGKSLSVCVAGTKAGVWSDFATGESGDLVDLWAAVRCGGNLSLALEEAKAYLGVRSERTAYHHEYSKPAKPRARRPQGQAEQYLESRGLHKSTIEAYRVAADHDSIYFPFLRDGELVMCKWRSMTDKATAPTSKNQEPSLFGWQAIPETAREIYITEGEFDAMAMYQMGYPAVSVPFGGGTGAKHSWIENEFNHLERFEKIYLCMDTDEAGVAAQEEISKRLGIERCLSVSLPAKDANDCLLQGLDVAKAIAGATNYDPEILRKPSEYLDEIIELFHPTSDKPEFLPIAWDKVRGKLGLRESELSIWNGISGSGKTQVLGHQAVHLIRHGKRVCIASMELKPNRLLQRITRQSAGLKSSVPSIPYIRAINQRLNEHLWVFDCLGEASLDEVLETFAYARKRYGVEFFVIDSLMTLDINEDDLWAQKKAIQKVTDFKNKYNCHVALVTHSRKKENENARLSKMDISGSAAVANLADTIIHVCRNKKKEELLRYPDEDTDLTELANQPDVILRVDKQRNDDGWEGDVPLWFCTNTWQYLEGPSIGPKPLINNWMQEQKEA
jgi:twinkle protein